MPHLPIASYDVLWSLSEPSRLGPKLRRLLDNPKFVPLVSTVSLWEILAKTKAGKSCTLPLILQPR